MTSARYPLPTDIVALVSFDGRVYPNEAKPLDQLGIDKPAHPLETALEQWFSFATGQQTWVSVRGATIRGLISARRRAKRSAWEVEVLIDASDDESVVLSLFSRLTAGVIRQGAERVFLRLESASPLVQVARSAGFFLYGRETLYRREAAPRAAPPDLPLRRREDADQPGIYQMYTRAVPATVRSIEGATFREWQAAQERWGRCTDLVLDGGGVIGGWVRAQAGQVGRIQVLALEGAAPYEELAHAALALVKNRPVFCLASDHNAGLISALRGLDFEPVATYTAMAKRLARPVGEMVTETAGTAVPAN